MIDQHLTLGICAILVSVVVGTTLTPVVRSLALSLGAVDEPDHRRVHQDRIPRMGGAAIVVAYLAALLACLQLDLLQLAGPEASRLLGFAVGGAAIVLVGLIDDIRGMSAKFKLGGQVTAAAIVWAFGVRINPILIIPGFGATDLGIVFSFVATLGWILVITNAINLIDGLDGLAGGVVFFAAITNLVVAFLTNNVLGIALNAALAGAVLGFLFYNFNPARIFMGDTGSLFLGFALSAGALLTSRQKESTLASLLVPLIALGLPLTDTLLAMARRFVARRSIFSADREHLHHQLLDLGLTQRKAVLILYGCSVALCAVSVAAVFGQDWTVGAALLFALLVLVGIVRFAGSIQTAVRQRQERAHLYTPATRAARQALFLLNSRRGGNVELSVEEELCAVLASDYFPAVSVTDHEGTRRWWRPFPEVPDGGGRSESTCRDCTFVLPARDGQPPRRLQIFCVVEGNLPPQLEVLLSVVVEILAGSPNHQTLLEDADG